MLLFRKWNSIIYYCAVFFGLLASSKKTRPTEKKEERAAARRYRAAARNIAWNSFSSAFLGRLGLSNFGIAFRSLGKISGAFVSGRATRCSHNIQKYLGITLLPQAGVALGMAAEAAELSDGHMVRNVVLFSVLVYELVGPALTKLALTAAGEIIPEGRTNARMANKPEFPVSLD